MCTVRVPHARLLHRGKKTAQGLSAHNNRCCTQPPMTAALATSGRPASCWASPGPSQTHTQSPTPCYAPAGSRQSSITTSSMGIMIIGGSNQADDMQGTWGPHKGSNERPACECARPRPTLVPNTCLQRGMLCYIKTSRRVGNDAASGTAAEQQSNRWGFKEVCRLVRHLITARMVPTAYETCVLVYELGYESLHHSVPYAPACLNALGKTPHPAGDAAPHPHHNMMRQPCGRLAPAIN